MQEHEISPALCDALLFFSRLRIPANQTDRAREICARIDNWPQFIERATAKYSLPMILRNLSALGDCPAITPHLELMKMQSLAITFGGLRAMGVQRKFHDTCIAPLNAAHVYIKGPTLAAQFYDDPALRFARDIDVLVSRDDQLRIVSRAKKQGYRLIDSTHSGISDVTDADEAAFLKYNTVATLRTSDNMLIEIHRDIDKGLGMFSAMDVIARRSHVEEYSVMPLADLFCYVCYHNSRHMWSRLHWMVDLDAMIGHAEFEVDAVLARADALGLRRTVAACLDLHKFAISGSASDHAKAGNHGAALLAGCLRNLRGDLELEYDLRKGESLLGLPFEWMVSAPIRARGRRIARLSKFRPNYEDYQARPLPAPLHWLYYIMKPTGSLHRYITGKFRPKAGQSNGA